MATLSHDDSHNDVVYSSLRLAGSYAIAIYAVFFAAKPRLGASGAHFFVTGIHSAIASGLAVTLLLSQDTVYDYYSYMVLSASFMLADLPIWIRSASSGCGDSELRSTVIHHLASMVGSCLLLQPQNASLPIASLTTLVELSTVLFCFRQVLRTQDVQPPFWLDPLFYGTHVLLRGPVLFYMVLAQVPPYITPTADQETIPAGRWGVLACGIPFVLLNQVWNWAIVKKYLPQPPQEEKKIS